MNSLEFIKIKEYFIKVSNINYYYFAPSNDAVIFVMNNRDDALRIKLSEKEFKDCSNILNNLITYRDIL